MLKLSSSDSKFIDIYNSQDYGTSANGVGIDVQLSPGPWKTDIDSKVLELQRQMIDMQTELSEQKYLRDTHPGVKDAYEKYQIMLALATKDKAEAIDA